MQHTYAIQELTSCGEIAGMVAKRRLIRATVSLDKDDYAALGKLANRMEVSASWLIRQAIRDFLDKYGEHGQPELALRLADKNRN
jgi:hypothetical protein